MRNWRLARLLFQEKISELHLFPHLIFARIYSRSGRGTQLRIQLVACNVNKVAIYFCESQLLHKCEKHLMNRVSILM